MSGSPLQPPAKSRSNDSAGSAGASASQLGSAGASPSRVGSAGASPSRVGSAGASPSRVGSERAAPSLLVSVRSEWEIDAAIAGGADIVDLKEPSDGALAPTSVQLWQSVAQRAGKHPLIRFSAALGESKQARLIASGLPQRFAFAKVGPSGCGSQESLRQLWSDIRQLLSPQIELVAVAYADHLASGCLPAEQVFALASECGFKRGLIDTYVKDGRSTIDLLGTAALQRLSQLAERHRLWWALAGSIRLDQAESLRRQNQIQPDCFAVRGDVCEAGRTGVLSVSRLAAWKAVLNAADPSLAGPES